MPQAMAKSDMLLILRKWMEEESVLSCLVKSPFSWVSIVGRISFLDDVKFSVGAPDNAPGSGVAVSLDAPSSAKYGDARFFPDETRVFESGFVLDFGPDDNEGLNFVALCELKK